MVIRSGGAAPSAAQAPREAVGDGDRAVGRHSDILFLDFRGARADQASEPHAHLDAELSRRAPGDVAGAEVVRDAERGDLADPVRRSA
jgi:hypothetical protein